MATPLSTDLGQPHLVTLVLQSKKALQHGEQLCTRADALSNASAQCVIDVMALDAKVKWVTDAVLEQLKLAAVVAKSIEQKRELLLKRVQEWDSERTRRTDALDNILDSLGSQAVPPDFHQDASDSSIFGSQPSDGEKPSGDPTLSPQLSFTPTVKDARSAKAKKMDRSKWKTLRDFVDERAIQEALDTMDQDREILDDVLLQSAHFSNTIQGRISELKLSLPPEIENTDIIDVITSQEKISTVMAHHLESLAKHYDEMASALHDSEGGEEFSEEDLQAMNRDTNELPAIMTELEESVSSIEDSHQKLADVRIKREAYLESHRKTMDELDVLGDLMDMFLERNRRLESECENTLAEIQHHLTTLEELHQRYLSFQTSFSKLLLEVARRKYFVDSAQRIIHGMAAQLDALTEEERRIRDDFREEHGSHLPEDICYFIQNAPTKWEIVPWTGDAEEALPEVDQDLLATAREHVSTTEQNALLQGSQSL